MTFKSGQAPKDWPQLPCICLISDKFLYKQNACKIQTRGAVNSPAILSIANSSSSSSGFYYIHRVMQMVELTWYTVALADVHDKVPDASEFDTQGPGFSSPLLLRHLFAVGGIPCLVK